MNLDLDRLAQDLMGAFADAGHILADLRPLQITHVQHVAGCGGDLLSVEQPLYVGVRQDIEPDRERNAVTKRSDRV